MRKNIKKVICLVAILIVFSIIFYILLRLPLDIKIYTYKGIILLGITTSLLIITTIILMKKNILSIDLKDVIITILIFLLFHIVVFGMIAITIERSFSVFMLSEIAKKEDQTISLEETEKLFVEKYVENYKAFEKRFEEQINTGTLKQVSENNYKMTEKGNFIVFLFNMFDWIYNVNSDLL